MQRLNRNKSLKQQSGASMVEVLVAMLPLTISALSTANLMTAGRQINIESVQLGLANQAGFALAERMRANDAAVTQYYTADTPVGGNSRQTVNCTAANPCTAAQIAQSDLKEFERILDGDNRFRTDDNGVVTAAGGLINSRACIEGPLAGGAGMYTVAIAWRGSTPQQNPASHACAAASGLYGDNNEYRRVRVLTFYLN